MKPTAKDILELLRNDLKVRKRDYKRAFRNEDFTDASTNYWVNDYIEWLIEHIEYWIEHKEQP